jgi:hypothetical protein
MQQSFARFLLYTMIHWKEERYSPCVDTSCTLLISVFVDGFMGTCQKFTSAAFQQAELIWLRHWKNPRHMTTFIAMGIRLFLWEMLALLRQICLTNGLSSVQEQFWDLPLDLTCFLWENNHKISFTCRSFVHFIPPQQDQLHLYTQNFPVIPGTVLQKISS